MVEQTRVICAIRAIRGPESFLFVPKELASVLNAISGYILAQATVQKLAEQLSQTSSRTEDGR